MNVVIFCYKLFDILRMFKHNLKMLISLSYTNEALRYYCLTDMLIMLSLLLEILKNKRYTNIISLFYKIKL